MDNLLTDAGLIHEQAERMHVLALRESDKRKQRVMFAVAEHYYLLHDRLQELEQFEPAQNVAIFALAKP
ncbi:MAG TPA: hypothetical protein VFA87_03905 [Rhizomicrobium sp.]|nr:hypothetical protein [Rhizomicrobium sp.]